MTKKSKSKKRPALSQDSSAGQTALTTKKDELKVPKSLVIRRGQTAVEVTELVDNLRHMMLPFTALQFKEDAKNRKLTLAQYATHLALPMGISHILAFSQNHERLHLRLARLPAGPTLQFRVHAFSLNRHLKALQKRPVSFAPVLSAHPPIVVTNNFGDHSTNAVVAPHVKLLRITFQNLFPAINVSTVRLQDCRRVVLFNYLEQEVEEEEKDASEEVTEKNDTKPKQGGNKNKQPTQKEEAQPDAVDNTQTKLVKKKRQLVEIRHYSIKATPVGVHRRIRRIVQAKLPNLHKCQDIADYLNNAAASDVPSDSEPEDDPQHVVQLPDQYAGRGNQKDNKSALKLVELGPRLSLELTKVEKGLGAGDVLYHAHVTKTAEEAAALKRRKEAERNAKEQRRLQQEANVERKRKAMEEKKEAKRQRNEEREKAIAASLRQGKQDDLDDSEDSDEDVTDGDNDDSDDSDDSDEQS